VLIDVLISGRHVALLGAADRSMIGRRVAITFTSTHRRVATAVVGVDGFFGATAPLPARRLRFTNRALYRATVGSESSQALKLVRRMIVRSISSHGGKVTLAGKITPPRTRPLAAVLVKRRVSCSTSVTVKRVRPRRDGTFTATLAAPRGLQAAVYEATTRVRAVARSRKTYPSFTLPREVVVQ
jgi:hypothetical protein